MTVASLASTSVAMRANFAYLVLLAGCTSAYAETDENNLEKYTHCVLTRLLDASGDRSSREGWEVIVLDENELALSVLPGHKLAIDAGLVRFSNSTDQLAHAIAHDLGHAIARHGWDDDHGIAQEREASRIAVMIASDAGFSPREGLGFWRRVAAERTSIFVRLHPSPEENAHVLQDNLRDADERYRSAVTKRTGPACTKPRMDVAETDLRYASASLETGGTR